MNRRIVFAVLLTAALVLQPVHTASPVSGAPSAPIVPQSASLATPQMADPFGVTVRDEWSIAGVRDLAVQAGVKWARASVYWSSVEATQGTYSFGWLDSYFAQF